MSASDKISFMNKFIKVAAARTSELVNLVLSRQTGFYECELLIVDKTMFITEPAVASPRL